MKRRFIDAPDGQRCEFGITLKDSSGARCGRHAKHGDLCTQHWRIVLRDAPRVAARMQNGAAYWDAAHAESKTAPRAPRWEVVESRVWKRDDGAKASIYGACPWASDAEKPRWQVVGQGWTLRNLRSGTVGTGRVPYATREEAQRACDEFNAQ